MTKVEDYEGGLGLLISCENYEDRGVIEGVVSWTLKCTCRITIFYIDHGGQGEGAHEYGRGQQVVSSAGRDGRHGWRFMFNRSSLVAWIRASATSETMRDARLLLSFGLVTRIRCGMEVKPKSHDVRPEGGSDSQSAALQAQ